MTHGESGWNLVSDGEGAVTQIRHPEAAEHGAALLIDNFETFRGEENNG